MGDAVLIYGMLHIKGTTLNRTYCSGLNCISYNIVPICSSDYGMLHCTVQD